MAQYLMALLGRNPLGEMGLGGEGAAERGRMGDYVFNQEGTACRFRHPCKMTLNHLRSFGPNYYTAHGEFKHSPTSTCNRRDHRELTSGSTGGRMYAPQARYRWFWTHGLHYQLPLWKKTAQYAKNNSRLTRRIPMNKSSSPYLASIHFINLVSSRG